MVLGRSLSYLGIYVSLPAFHRTEEVSRRLQQRGVRLKAPTDAVCKYTEYYDERGMARSQFKISKLDLGSPQLTRVRRPPQKLEQTATVTAPCQYDDV